MFHNTPALYAEPLKKKKRIDPNVIKAREERRKRKLEKQIRRLQKSAKTLKPIDDLEVPLNLLDEKATRQRKLPELSAAVKEERAALIKEWSIYRNKLHAQNLQIIDNLVSAQQKALQELRAESEELYQEAVQPDATFLPYYAVGPVLTPPIKDYASPDGDYQDVSQKWE